MTGAVRVFAVIGRLRARTDRDTPKQAADVTAPVDVAPSWLFDCISAQGILDPHTSGAALS